MILFQDKLLNSKAYKQSKLIAEKFSQATLTAEVLYWWEEDKRKSLFLKNVIGVSSINTNEELPGFVIYSYPLISKRFAKSRRKLQEDKFFCPTNNVQLHWLAAIRNVICNEFPRHFHVFVNPYSGTKNGENIFKQVQHLFVQSNITWQLTKTIKSGNIKEQIKNISIDKIDGFIIVGGDGTIHETINGLMSRADWKVAIKKPIGIIPAGTGNGLCKSLLEIAGEPYNPISAAFLIAKGKLCPVDLAIIEQAQNRYYSILSVSWALPSDIDIESERMRYLGVWRNIIYTLLRLCFLRIYKGRFSFVPQTNSSEQKLQVIEGNFILFWAMNSPWAAYDLKIAPLASLNDGAIDVLIIRQGVSRLLLLIAFLKCGNGSHISLPGVEYYKVKQFFLEPISKLNILAVDGEKKDDLPIRLSLAENFFVLFFCGHCN